MARITVEDCLKRVPNRFLIVNLAARRVRQIREGSEYLVSSPKNEDIVVALRELAAGKVKLRAAEITEAMQEFLPADEAQAEAPAPEAAEPDETEPVDAEADAADAGDEPAAEAG